MSSDIIIIFGMLVAGVVGVGTCVWSRLVFGKIGFLLCAVFVCIGLSCFGWRPMLGWRVSQENSLGCVAIGLGLIGFCVLGAIEEVARRYLAAGDESRGFPVITPTTEDRKQP